MTCDSPTRDTERLALLMRGPLRSWLTIGLLFTAAAGSSCDRDDACTSYTDCQEGQRCGGGQCVGSTSNTGGATGGGTSAAGGGTGGGATVMDAGTARGWLFKPFTGEFRLSNFFDHDIPRQFIDTNGRQVTFWGEETTFIDGHSGYDFVMAEGTPILAAAAGVVHFAGTEPAFFCPQLGVMTGATVVTVDTVSPEQVLHRVEYVHLSRVDVTKGQQVTVGQQLGLSGNTGCSTGPHLHFEVKAPDGSPRAPAVDPFGWTAASPDPWVAAGGPVSAPLWAANQAPQLFRHVVGDLSMNSGSWLVLTTVRWMGVDDARNRNNEFVEISRDPAFAPASVSLSGYSLRNLAGVTVPLPSATLTAATPSVRVYSGAGTNSATSVYLDLPTPLWNNRGDCARLVFPNGNAWSLFFGRNDCP